MKSGIRFGWVLGVGLSWSGIASGDPTPPATAGGVQMPTSFELLGVARMDDRFPAEGAPLGGLSGLAWDAAAGRLLAISDDRSEHAPARLFRLRVDLADGRLETNGASTDGATTLRTRAGATFPARALDAEGIALGRDRFYVSSEGEAKKGIAPFVAEFELDGRLVRELPLPASVLPVSDIAGGQAVRGLRDNLGFESLAISPDGRYLFAGLENGLAQESPAATPGVASVTRLFRWDLEKGGAAAEFLYRVEPVNVTPPSPTDFLVNGLVELTALDDRRLLALERQWVPGVGVSIRLYAISLDGLADVAGFESDSLAAEPTAAKTLLFDFKDLGIPLDNFEGMDFGPPLPDGRRTFFVVSDDNFDAARQSTFLVGFAVGFDRLSIAALQGAAHRSPYEGRFVSAVEGVVTATESTKRDRGFWLESESPDGDPATSEAIYVAWEGADTLRAGQRVRVGGRVEERASGKNLPVTTLALIALESLSEDAALPPPPRLGRDVAIPRSADDDGLARFEPLTDAIDLWESLESMRVELPAGTVVGPTRSFGDIALLPDGAEVAARTARGGVTLDPAGPDLDRVIVGRRLAGRMPDLAVGDRVDAPFVGIVDYGFSTYRVQPLAPLTTSTKAACGERTALAAARGALRLATLNVENLSIARGEKDEDRMPIFGRVIAEELGAPAIVALEEIQDDSGVADDGTVSSRATVDAFIAAIAAAGGPRYEAAWIDPENNRDGGQPGGNIRVVLLYDPRRATLVRRGAAGATDSTAIAGKGRKTALTLSPGRIAATSTAFSNPSGEGVRKSLAAEFRVGRKSLFVIANHLTSKWDDDRLFGARQPPVTPTGAKRLEQMRELRTFAESLLAANPKANLVILGDLNEPEWADGLVHLSRPPLVNLIEKVPPGDRYTFNFEGTSQAIDHVVVSPALAAGAGIDIVHRNSDCPDSLRVSDHDPIVARLRLR